MQNKRNIVFQKYDGRCAYCGIELNKGWHIDHIIPKIYGGTNDLDNLNPSCKYCNNYKCHSQLETFRAYLKQMVNEKHEYLFKSVTKMRIAINIGAVTLEKWDGMFHFERILAINQSREA